MAQGGVIRSFEAAPGLPRDFFFFFSIVVVRKKAEKLFRLRGEPDDAAVHQGGALLLCQGEEGSDGRAGRPGRLAQGR